MFIFIEETIFINALINIFFVFIIASLFYLKINKLKLIISCFIASVFTIIFSYSNFSIITDVLIVLFILSFSVKNLTPKKLIQTFVMYFVVSNLFYKFLSYNLISNNRIFLSSSIPLILFICLFMLVTTIIKTCLKFVNNKLKLSNNICLIETKYKNKTYKTYGYLDSGNNLHFNNKPVSIINFKMFKQITGVTLADYLANNFKIENGSYINVSTVTGQTNLLSFMLDELKIYSGKKQKTYENAIVAISLKLKNCENYDIILNNNYI